jgi:phage anti-repressor protein
MGYLRDFEEQAFNAPISTYSGVLCQLAWAHGLSARRWKEKMFRLDHQKHLLFSERSAKIATYDLKDYMLRVSKNKDYHSLVLMAVNNNPLEKHHSLHIGFDDKAKYQQWYDALKFSI